MLAIPAAFDCCGSSLMFIGLTQCAASVYQMMRGAVVLITAIFSVVFLGRKQYFHHMVGVIIIVAGASLVGYTGIKASQKEGDDSGNSQTTLLGVMCIVAAQCFTGGQFVTEEKFLSGYYLDPMYVVGLEGMFGCIYYSILLPIFQNVDCTTDGMCTEGKIENSRNAFDQMKANPVIIVIAIGIIVSIGCFNVTGVATTKYASAAQRSTVDTSRTLFIWLFGLATGEAWLWGQFAAFILLIGGTLIYNEIVVIPIDIMRNNTAIERMKREKKEQGILDGDDTTTGFLADGNQTNYMATSPHAAYDQNRNVRNIERKMNERDDLLGKHNNNAANTGYNSTDDNTAR